jgi:quinol-cytochrome oxidoreductase complex cytochrome b subunit
MQLKAYGVTYITIKPFWYVHIFYHMVLKIQHEFPKKIVKKQKHSTF